MTGRLLTLAQAADKLGCSKRTLRRRVRDGSLPVFRDGGLVRVREIDVERYVAANITQTQLRRRGVRAAGVVLPADSRLWDGA